jgi:hypothetical protein
MPCHAVDIPASRLQSHDEARTLGGMARSRDDDYDPAPTDLTAFAAALRAEMQKSPEIVPPYTAAQQSWAARRQRRDAIIAERGRLHDASERLLAGEMLKLKPTGKDSFKNYVKRRDVRERELRELRKEWWRLVDEMWPVPPTELERIMREIPRGLWWAALIVAGLALVWFLMRWS